jgi:integral membrane sensor domain MASE1
VAKFTYPISVRPPISGVLNRRSSACAYCASWPWPWLSLTVAFVHGTVSPVWPPSGLAIAALTLWGPRLWPAIALGAFSANTLIGDPVPLAAGIAAGNSLEAVLGALALRRLAVRGEVALIRDAVAILAVSALAPLASATGGVLSLTLGGYSPWARYPWVWLVWWVGDFMGALLTAPLVLGWFGQRAPHAAHARPVEFAGALALAAAAVSVVYLRGGALAVLGVERLPLSAFLFPPVVWAVLRLPPRQAVTVVATAAALAVVYVVELTHGDSLGPLLWLQLLSLGLGGGSLLLIGALNEREQAMRARERAMVQVEASKARLEFALESAHATLWDWDVVTDRVRWSDEFFRSAGLDRRMRPDFDTWCPLWCRKTANEPEGSRALRWNARIRSSGWNSAFEIPKWVPAG